MRDRINTQYEGPKCSPGLPGSKPTLARGEGEVPAVLIVHGICAEADGGMTTHLSRDTRRAALGLLVTAASLTACGDDGVGSAATTSATSTSIASMTTAAASTTGAPSTTAASATSTAAIDLSELQAAVDAA